MRQIGVREEASLVGGFAHCGQELCCARLGCGFQPVSIRMAKEQDLPLNSPKISGACGRLMCCLRYEFEAYKDFKQRAPKRNASIDTPLGEARCVDFNTPREEITLRLENGKSLKVPLSGMCCSERACAKAEENHCPCRPDTVTREALEELQSPEVQSALGELDRENGVLPATPEEDLVLVSAKRRRHMREKGKERTYEVEAQVEDALVGEGRRRGRGDDAAGAGTGGAGGARRRTRRSRAEKNAEGATVEAAAPEARERTRSAAEGEGRGAAAAGARRSTRRRHHAAEGGAGEATAPVVTGAAEDAAGARVSRQEQGQDGQPSKRARRSRRVGDRGGNRERTGGNGERQERGDRQERQDRPRNAATSANGTSGESGEGGKRRRRRGGRGRGRGKGGEGGNTGVSE
jgi:hypothetical protein